MPPIRSDRGPRFLEHGRHFGDRLLDLLAELRIAEKIVAGDQGLLQELHRLVGLADHVGDPLLVRFHQPVDAGRQPVDVSAGRVERVQGLGRLPLQAGNRAGHVRGRSALAGRSPVLIGAFSP